MKRPLTNAIVLILLALTIYVVSLSMVRVYFDKEEPVKTEDVKVETKPLVIDIPDNTRHCNITVYNSEDEVIFSYLGDVTFERGCKDNDPMKLTIKMPDAGVE